MIVITGAGGFLGQYCVRDLSEKGLPLFLTTSNVERCGDVNGLPRHYLDLADPASLANLPDRIETVIHLAAIIPEKNVAVPFSRFMEINATGTKRLAEEALRRGCTRFIYASTQMVVEKPFYLPVDEEHPYVPVSYYGFSKAAGEHYCMELADKLSVISLRFVGLYGPGEKPGFVLGIFLDRARRSVPLIVNGTGRIMRDLLYVKDAAAAVSRALASDTSGIYNIGSGRGTSLGELARTISDVFSEGRSAVEFREDVPEQGEDFYMDISKARRELGFHPEYSLMDGMADYKRELSGAGLL